MAVAVAAGGHRGGGRHTLGVSTSESAPTFADLGLRPELLQALTALGYEEPTPIQREAIPPLLAGRDLLGQAATGTGKTAAFALPLLQRLRRRTSAPAAPTALVLVPTRELAVQVSEAVHRYGRATRRPGAAGLRRPARSGGSCGRCRAGVDVVVATPGRALDHSAAARCSSSDLRTVVLDEADEMLDMGFAEDIEAILAETPEQPADGAVLGHDAAAHRRHRPPAPAATRCGSRSARERAAPARRRWCARRAYVVPRAHKPAALGRVLDVEAPAAAIVFCRTRDEVDQLTETLNGRGYRAEALHGGMSQEQRDRVMGRLRAGTADLLVATDVAARGLDVEHLTHVVNYDVPSRARVLRAPHRPGRPGRPRGRGDHPRRAARAPDAQDHRAGHRPADRRRDGAHGRRPAGAPAGADPGRAAREPARPTTSTGSASSSRRSPTSST